MYLLVIKRSKNLFEDEKIQQNVFTCLCEEGGRKGSGTARLRIRNVYQPLCYTTIRDI